MTKEERIKLLELELAYLEQSKHSLLSNVSEYIKETSNNQEQDNDRLCTC